MSTEDHSERLLLDAARREVVDLAEMRRTARLSRDAFFEQTGWTALTMASMMPTGAGVEPRDRAKAAEIIDRYATLVSGVVESMPALSATGALNAGAAIDECFGVFHSYPFMRNLDLWRRQHRLDVSDWTSTDALDAGYDSLIDELSSVEAEAAGGSWLRYSCAQLEKNINTCQMVMQFISPASRTARIAHCMRITNKAIVVDAMTGDVINIAKRTEFIVDLSRLDPRYAARLQASMDAGSDGYQLGWNPKAYKTMESLITNNRDSAIQPIYTTLFAFRELQVVQDILTSPAELEPYPNLFRLVYDLGHRLHWIDEDYLARERGHIED